MDIDEKKAYMWLNHFSTFRLGERDKLIEHFGSAKEVYIKIDSMDIPDLIDLGLKKETCEELKSTDTEEWYEELRINMERSSTEVVTPVDSAYPERLTEISGKPLALYYRGDINIASTEALVAVIGSRRPTHYGSSVADEFSAELGRRGITIVSGMAMGIDSIAHRGALRGEGKTIAVLGGGVDICYPRTNFDIYQKMLDMDQLILSEYEPGTQHMSLHFPARNRIISGLSDGVLVVEAALRSGTLITAGFALDQGKSIYAVPGRTSDMLSKGTNSLIKDGAMLVDSPADIILDMISAGMIDEKKAAKKKSSVKKHLSVTPLQKKLLGMLGYEPVYIDDLIRANDMNISETLSALRNLEENGLVRSIEQSYFVLVR